MISKFFERERNIYVLIFALTFCVFGNSILNERALDDEYIFNTLDKLPEQATIVDVFQTRYNNVDYRPIVVATFFLEKKIGFQNDHISHFINVLLYAFLCLLIYLPIKALNFKHSKYVALATCLLFLVHPCHSNVVASLKSRDGILSALFGMAALYSFILAVGHKRYYTLVFIPIFLLFGMLSKLDAVVFVGLIPFTYIFFYLGRKINVNLIKRAIILLVFTFGLYQVFEFRRDLKDNTKTEEVVMEGQTVTGVDYEENPIVNAESKSALFAYAVQTSLKYLSFMVIPHGYWFYFGFDTMPVLQIHHPQIIFGILLHVLLLLIFLYGFYKKQNYAYGIGFYFIAILPFLNFLQPVAGIFAVRYAFISSIGFAFLVGSIFTEVYHGHFLDKWMKEQRRKRALLYIAGCVLVIFAALAIERNSQWKNKDILFEHDIKHLANSFNSNFIIGSHHLEKFETQSKFRKANELKKALKYLQRANEIYPNNSQVYAQMGQVHYLLGDRQKAKSDLHKSLELERRNFKTLMLLSDFYLQEKNYDLAEEYLLQAINVDINIKKSGLYFKLTNFYNNIGKHEKALAINLNQIAEDSLNYVIHQNLGNTYLFLHDTATAAAYLQRALDLGLDAPQLQEQLNEYYNK